MKFQRLEIRVRKVPTPGKIAGFALALAAAAACGEEVVSYSASVAGTNDWRAEGLRLEATNRTLRLTLERDGEGRAVLDRHCAAMPNGIVRWLGRAEGDARATLEIAAGEAKAQLPLRGWEEPADYTLPAEARACAVAIRVNGAAGATVVLRDLLVTGSLDLDPPLLHAWGSAPEVWHAQGVARFTGGGLGLAGAVETRDRFSITNRAVVVLRLAAAERGGLRIAGRAWGAEGEQLGDVALGTAARVGAHRFDAEAAALPAGCTAITLLLESASSNATATVWEILVGRTP
jgi:hypothetical protein